MRHYCVNLSCETGGILSPVEFDAVAGELMDVLSDLPGPIDAEVEIASEPAQILDFYVHLESEDTATALRAALGYLRGVLSAREQPTGAWARLHQLLVDDDATITVMPFPREAQHEPSEQDHRRPSSQTHGLDRRDGNRR